jgi:hypothetical protein
MGNLDCKIPVKGKLRLMIGDKEKSTSKLIEPIVRKSKIIRSSSLRATSENLPQKIIKSAHFLNDEEAIAVKRVATSKYLDFPHVLRGGSVDGVIPFGSSIDESAVGGFLKALQDEEVFVFLEPWLMCGAALLSTTLLASSFWEMLESCDYSLKIYDVDLTKSCILSADEDEKELKFSIAK